MRDIISVYHPEVAMKWQQFLHEFKIALFFNDEYVHREAIYSKKVHRELKVLKIPVNETLKNVWHVDETKTLSKSIFYCPLMATE